MYLYRNGNKEETKSDSAPQEGLNIRYMKSEAFVFVKLPAITSNANRIAINIEEIFINLAGGTTKRPQINEDII